MSHRKMTPKGQMSRSTNSGPAIMLIPPHVRATFMPNPPLKHIPPLKLKRKKASDGGLGPVMVQFERTPAPPRKVGLTPKALKEAKFKAQAERHAQELEPQTEAYRKEQRECGGEYEGMNCYNTLFVGRLAYEVTERKLLRELEIFGPIKDLKLIKSRDGGKSKGYAFVEYEHEEDMKRAFRAADGMRIEGREVVVDVERGHTVPNWLPRRLGGGLGGTRIGGKDKNVTAPGRFDPTRPEASRPPMGVAPPGPMGRGGGGPPPYGGASAGGRGPPYPDAHGPGGSYGGPPPLGGMGRGGGDRYGPPRGGGGRDWDRGGRANGGGDYDHRKRFRSRSRSPDRRQGRRRY